MIGKSLLAGFLAIGFLFSHTSEEDHRPSMRLSDSNFHRYPARALFTSDGKLLIAYRTAQLKAQSSTLQIAEFDVSTRSQIAKHSYAVPSAGSTKISDGFVMARDGHSLYYVELTGNPVALEISTSTFDILSQSTAKLFDATDFIPRVECVTDKALFLSAGSRLSGKVVHLVALDKSDLSQKIFDEQLSGKPGFGQSYKLSFTGDSLWIGNGRYWLKIGIRSEQIEAQINAQNDVHQLRVFSGGLIGMTNLGSAGYLQFFDEEGRQMKTLEEPGCGFVSVELSPDERYGVAVCEKTGTSEWSFGKTLGRAAVIFDRQTTAVIKSVPLSKMSLKSPSDIDGTRLWYPEPMIWDSGRHIVVDLPDLSGTLSVEELTLAEH